MSPSAAPGLGETSSGADRRPETIPQYSAGRILGLWAAVTAPMGLMAFVVAPLMAPHVGLHRGLLHWILMVVGMAWQCGLSIMLLRREGPMDWVAVRKRIWLNGPRDPRTGQARARLWWWVVPAIAANVLLGFAADPLVSLWSRLTGLEEPAWASITALAQPEFVGQWWIVGLALVSSAFNYVLGEELFFRGILLPRMEKAFGRWDWVVNTLLFGLYHVHKIWFWPTMVMSSFGTVWAARRYRSLWMSIAVHGVESLFVIVVLAVVAGWWMP